MAKAPIARSPEERQNQLISKAYDLVEKRIDDETATSQETTFFLKMGSSREKVEQMRLQEEVKLLKAKTEALAAVGEIKTLIHDAMAAMSEYQGREKPIELPNHED